MGLAHGQPLPRCWQPQNAGSTDLRWWRSPSPGAAVRVHSERSIICRSFQIERFQCVGSFFGAISPSRITRNAAENERARSNFSSLAQATLEPARSISPLVPNKSRTLASIREVSRMRPPDVSVSAPPMPGSEPSPPAARAYARIVS